MRKCLLTSISLPLSNTTLSIPLSFSLRVLNALLPHFFVWLLFCHPSTISWSFFVSISPSLFPFSIPTLPLPSLFLFPLRYVVVFSRPHSPQCKAVLYCSDQCSQTDQIRCPEDTSHQHWCEKLSRYMSHDSQLAELPFSYAAGRGRCNKMTGNALKASKEGGSIRLLPNVYLSQFPPSLTLQFSFHSPSLHLFSSSLGFSSTILPNQR